MSDIVGTTLMLGVTVAIVALVSVQTLGSIADEAPPPPVDVTATAHPGENALTLLHVGGPVLDAHDLRVVVAVGGSVLHDGRLGATGTTWALGESKSVPLAVALAPGDTVSVSVVSVAYGETLATTSARIPTPASPGATGPLAALSVAPASVAQLQALFLSAAVAHPQGRLAVTSVTADVSALHGPTALPLLDSGTAGDALAADGTFSGYTVVPISVAPGTYPVTVRAVDLDGIEVTDAGSVTVLAAGGGGTGGTDGAGGTGGDGSDGGAGVDGSVGGTGGDGADAGASGSGSPGRDGSNGRDGDSNSAASSLRLNYNRSLIKAFSHRTLKFEGGSHDRISVDVKIQLVADPVWIWDANSPSANKTDLYRFMPGTVSGGTPLGAIMGDYDWLKPGATDPFPLSDGGTPARTWFCHDASTEIFGFRKENLTINSFEQERDTLWYYFGATWQRLDASGNLVPGAYHRETIGSEGVDEYFVVPRSAHGMVITDDNGFTTAYDDCSF